MLLYIDLLQFAYERSLTSKVKSISTIWKISSKLKASDESKIIQFEIYVFNGDFN